MLNHTTTILTSFYIVCDLHIVHNYPISGSGIHNNGSNGHEVFWIIPQSNLLPMQSLMMPLLAFHFKQLKLLIQQ